MTIESSAGMMSRSSVAAESGLRRVLTSAAIGQFVEWYDFVVYAYSAAIIAKLFFPNTDPTAALLHRAQLGVLRVDLLLQFADLGERAISRTRHRQRHGGADRHAPRHRSHPKGNNPPAHAPTRQIQGFGHPLGARHQYDLHAFPR